MSNDTRDPDATFTYCEDCKAEHNGRGESREEYAKRIALPQQSKAQRLQAALDDLRKKIAKGPGDNPTFTINYIQPATLDRSNRAVVVTQQALTEYVATIQAIRTVEGEKELAVGDMIAALCRVAVDACCSADSASADPQAVKDLFGKLVDEGAVFYAKNKESIDKKLAAQKEIAKAMLTSLELSLSVALDEEKRAAEAAEKRGDAEKAIAVQATAVAANTSKTPAQKEHEMNTLLKAFTVTKNTQVH